MQGCVLRNTNWVYGVIVFAGHDTKLMMNSGKNRHCLFIRLFCYLYLSIYIYKYNICRRGVPGNRQAFIEQDSS